VDIVGRVNGTLLSKLYPSGAKVKKGQTLFVVDPTLYQNAVKQAEASLKTAKANLEYAKSNYERMKEAIKSEAVSRIQLVQAESNVQSCEAAVSNAEAELKTARSGHPFLVFSSVAMLALAAFAGGVLTGMSVSESRHRIEREARLREALSQIEGIASNPQVSTNSAARAVISGKSDGESRRNVAVVVIQ
jgi:multidrug resistance efflux pump